MARDEKDGFSATAWTIVEQAVHDRSALDKLLRRYWRPLWVHLIYTKRFSESEADDVVQEFITSRILERDLLARVDRHKGKFRSFLLKSLDRFVIDRHRSQNAAKAAPTHAASFAEGFDQAQVAAEVARILREVLLRPELGRVDEEGDDHVVALLLRAADEGEMPFV